METVREKMKTMKKRMEAVRDRYRLIVHLDYTLLPREENGLCVSGEEIKSKYDEMERAKDGDRERKDGDHDGKKK